ncbi:MAG: hypothetical protein SFY81_13255 [Verrucomicrobiota bacterium]|nr:hypothetical protein [Verrucomicrobiota bacterium]
MLKSLAEWASEISPGCREATRLQSQALDTSLPARKFLGLRIHLALCRWCRRYGKQIVFIRSVAHKDKTHDEAPSRQAFPPEARQRIKERLKSEK